MRVGFFGAIHRTEAGRLAHVGAPAGDCQTRVVYFAVINTAFQHGGRSPAPGTIRAEAQLAPVLQRHAQFAQEGEAVPEQAVTRVGFKAEASLIPAVAEHCAEDVVPLVQQSGHVVGLVLHPEVIIIIIGREVFVPDAFAVQIHLIQSKPAHIRPRRNRTARQADHAAHQRVNRAARGRDPLGLPRLAAFSRLKPRNPCSLVARLVAHRHPPIVARAGGEGDRRMVGEGIRIGVLAAVVQDFGEAWIGGDLDAGGFLPRAARVFGDPGQA